MALDLSAIITAIDAAITTLNAELLAGTQPIGVQSMSIAGRSISYSSFEEGIMKLTQWRMRLEEYNARISGNKTMFHRGRVTGLGT